MPPEPRTSTSPSEMPRGCLPTSRVSTYNAPPERVTQTPSLLDARSMPLELHISVPLHLHVPTPEACLATSSISTSVRLHLHIS